MLPNTSASSISQLPVNKCWKRGTTKKLIQSDQTICKQNLEVPGSFCWHHGRMGRKIACELLEENGQFLVRSARSKLDLKIKTVLSVKWNNRHYHFGIKKIGEYFTIEELSFNNIIQLISFYFTTKHPLTRQSKAVLLQPLYRSVEAEEPFILGGVLCLAVACAVVIFIYFFALK
ncbi:unnamed protein product [Litomosoides sigmodontis]|uniref:SH2 domain-containing protein n=1 Tax=Litomosoides sigmodontis TaxID=42156 RepID=A0A3P6T8S7_LITSI|nr:unnamed protein product [Litomosoides sigmodontis]